MCRLYMHIIEGHLDYLITICHAALVMVCVRMCDDGVQVRMCLCICIDLCECVRGVSMCYEEINFECRTALL